MIRYFQARLVKGYGSFTMASLQSSAQRHVLSTPNAITSIGCILLEKLEGTQ